MANLLRNKMALKRKQKRKEKNDRKIFATVLSRLINRSD